MATTPLADIPLSPSTPLTDAQKELVINSIFPIVLAAAKQQRPDAIIGPEKIAELRAKFTEEQCRWWINKAHEVKKEYLARGLTLPGAKRELEGEVEGQGRKKRAKTEEDEMDVEMLVNEHTNTRTQSAVTGEMSPPPAFSEAVSPKQDDVDMFSPPEGQSTASKSVEPTEEEQEMDMELDSDADDSPPPPPPVLASKQPTPASEAPPAPDPPLDVDEPPLPPPATSVGEPPAAAPVAAALSETTPLAATVPSTAPETSTAISQPTPATQPSAPSPVVVSEPIPPREPAPQPAQTPASAAAEPQVVPAPTSSQAVQEAEPAAAPVVDEPAAPPEPELVYATTPGIWGIAAGTKMSTTLEFELVIDDVTYDAARRWAARWDTFTDGLADSFVSVRLLCLPLAQVQELDAEVRAGGRSSAPADVAAAMAALPVSWPEPGSLMVTNGERSFYGDVFKPNTPFDITSLIQPGINTLRIFLIGSSHLDKVYALHAAPPSADEAKAVSDMWKAQRALVAGAERGRTTFGMAAQLPAGESMVVQTAA